MTASRPHETTTRLATTRDAQALCDVINPIIEKGGTTAYQRPRDAAYFEKMIAGFGPRDFMHVAEIDGRIVGFQFVEAHPDLDAETGDIASFVALDAAGRGVGQALARASFAEAKRRGWLKLHAYIRADNTGGLAYYESIGLRTTRIDEARPLDDGKIVDRVVKLISL